MDLWIWPHVFAFQVRIAALHNLAGKRLHHGRALSASGLVASIMYDGVIGADTDKDRKKARLMGGAR